jgi:hypothetical protein
MDSLPGFGEGRGGVRERSEQATKSPTLPPQTGEGKDTIAREVNQNM